jgi:hypothetical protein
VGFLVDDRHQYCFIRLLEENAEFCSSFALLEREPQFTMAAIVQKVEPATEVEYALMPMCVGAPAIVLARFPVEIGRALDVDVRLDDICVSRRHCRIVAVKGALFVRDLGSTNGTFINGVRTEVSPLRDNDVLSVGMMRFIVRSKPVTARSH